MNTNDLVLDRLEAALAPHLIAIDPVFEKLDAKGRTYWQVGRRAGFGSALTRLAAENEARKKAYSLIPPADSKLYLIPWC